MDESLQELENELKRLRPQAASPRLLARLEAELAEPAAGEKSPAEIIPFPAWLNWRTTAAAAAAVAFATVLFVARQTPAENPSAPTLAATAPASVVGETTAAPATLAARPLPAAPRYQPVGAASVLYDLREDAQVNQAAHTPVRRLRYRYVDTYTWKNPATNASLKWSVPRDEVRVIPASMH